MTLKAKGGLGRAEAIGVITIVVAYVASMLYSYTSQPSLFGIQHWFFSVITFILVALAFTFNKLELRCIRIDKHIIVGCVIAAVGMFALVNVIVTNPTLSQIAALSSVVPLEGMVVHQILYIGIGEGILHAALILWAKVVVKSWGLAILVGSFILGGLHVFAVGPSLPTLTFLALVFIIFAAFSKVPQLMGSKVGFALIISVVAHASYNLSLISLEPLARVVEIAVMAVV